jgi:hypothetical protein
MLVFSPSLLFWPGLARVGGREHPVLAAVSPAVFFGRAWNLHQPRWAVAGWARRLVLGIISANYAWTLGMRFAQSATARWLARVGDGLWSSWDCSPLGTGLWGCSFTAAVELRSSPSATSVVLASTLVTLGAELTGAAFVVSLVVARRP